MAQNKEHLIPYLTKEEIDELVSNIAEEIEGDYQGKEIILVCVLKGSILFLSDLMRKIKLPQKVDFVSLKTFVNDEGSTITSIVKDITTQITGKHVLIIEEIIDAGRKLSFLKNRLLASAPASLKVVTLLDKPARRVINIKPDYVGKTIEDRYVVGYGLDDSEIGRNYSDIYFLKN